jgi:hypothetical protein
MRYSSLLRIALVLIATACVHSSPTPESARTVTVRLKVVDSISGEPLAHANVQTFPWTGLKATDSSGSVTLRKMPLWATLEINCPTWRLPLGPRIYQEQLILKAANKDTTIVKRVPTSTCLEKTPVDRECRGHWTTAFEESLFWPCEGLPMQADSLRPVQRSIWAQMAPHVDARGVKWPEFSEPVEHATVYIRAAGTLDGPGHYGHLGVSGYQLTIDKIFEVRLSSPNDCK